MRGCFCAIFMDGKAERMRVYVREVIFLFAFFFAKMFVDEGKTRNNNNRVFFCFLCHFRFDETGQLYERVFCNHCY